MRPPAWIGGRIGSQLSVCRWIELPVSPAAFGSSRPHRKKQFSGPLQGLYEESLLGFCEPLHLAVEIVGYRTLCFDHGRALGPSKEIKLSSR